ncbi:peter Pan-like protein [Vairimorpha necatrix]|uniref:Peter Pan-like protein n=1 Tax=Vairimorpha necatrix TaxID=6039 RepID=A0AAX4J8L2_9MICR
MDENINKLVIPSKNAKKQGKILCTHLRKLFLPNTTYKLQDKNISIKKYKTLADELKMSHFIVTGDNYIKIGERPNGPTITFSVEEHSTKIRPFNNQIYSSDPVITFSGKSEHEEFFKKLSHPGKTPMRNLHFAFNGENIEIRHYKIETVEEEDIKVGLTEIGPRLTLKIKKIEDSFFPM